MAKKKQPTYLDEAMNPRKADTLAKILLSLQQKHNPKLRRLKEDRLPGGAVVVTTFREQALSCKDAAQWETIVCYPDGGPTHTRRFNGSVEVAEAEHAALVGLALVVNS